MMSAAPKASALAGPSAPDRASNGEHAAPFLLTMPAYSGTLAAARCLGRRGIPVTVAGGNLLSPARWSRHVTRAVSSPDVHDTARFLTWLLEFGEREPGHVLYPTCDDLAWLVASHAEELRRYYRLYVPEVTSILRLLDKRALHRECGECGIGVVPTAFPASHEEARRLADQVGFPMLLKPRTQIRLPGGGKGTVVERREDFDETYRGFISSGFWPPLCTELLPGVEFPMLQRYMLHASQGIYSLAGFIGRRERQIAVRASLKILQRPRRVGVGLCFEEAPVDRDLFAKVVRLCRNVGYFGVFEAEFIHDGGQPLLIDFNPRFYGQMGFEVGRRLPLASLAWLGAMGAEDEIDRETARAHDWREGRGYAYCDRLFLNVGLWAQRLSGRIPGSEFTRWRRWQRDRLDRALMIDAADAPDDHLPRVMAALGEVGWLLRHPRTSVVTILGGS